MEEVGVVRFDQRHKNFKVVKTCTGSNLWFTSRSWLERIIWWKPTRLNSLTNYEIIYKLDTASDKLQKLYTTFMAFYLLNSRYFSKLKLQMVPPYLSEISKKRHFFPRRARDAPTILSVRPVPSTMKSNYSSFKSNLFSFFFGLSALSLVYLVWLQVVSSFFVSCV